MTRFAQLMGIALISAAAVCAEPQPAQENERQPGTLRISGIHDSDRVLLDGELIGDGKRITRFGGKLLLQPGEYTVTILRANLQTCESEVSVMENRTTTAGCLAAEPQGELVD
jgi:hypothetical protein